MIFVQLKKNKNSLLLKSLKKSWIVCNKKSYLPKCFDYKSKILKGCIIRKESLPFGHVQPDEEVLKLRQSHQITIRSRTMLKVVLHVVILIYQRT